MRCVATRAGPARHAWINRAATPVSPVCLMESYDEEAVGRGCRHTRARTGRCLRVVAVRHGWPDIGLQRRTRLVHATCRHAVCLVVQWRVAGMRWRFHLRLGSPRRPVVSAEPERWRQQLIHPFESLSSVRVRPAARWPTRAGEETQDACADAASRRSIGSHTNAVCGTFVPANWMVASATGL